MNRTKDVMLVVLLSGLAVSVWLLVVVLWRAV